MTDYESIGRFRLFGPEHTHTDMWALADDGGWLPGGYADRSAVTFVMGYLAGSYADVDALEKLRASINDMHTGENRAITLTDLVQALAGDA